MKNKRKKTELGRTLAKIRIDFDETGADMAKKLDISSSQMFNIEVGLAQVGYEFVAKVKKVYEIDLMDIMRRGGFMSKITLDLDELSQADKDTVLKIWAGKMELDDLAVGKVELEKITVTPPAEDQPLGRKAATKARVVTDKPTRPRPAPKSAEDEGVGFLSVDDADELEGLTEEDVT